MDRSQGRRRDLERIRGSQPEVRRELAQLAKKLAPVQGQVVEWRKNGVYVDVAGVHVFIDVAHLESRGPLPDPRVYMGRQLAFELVDVGPHSAKGNRRSLLAKQRLGFEESTKIGDRVIARVREIRIRTVILEINNVYLSVHLSELSHNWVSEPAEVLSIGEFVEVEITEILNRSNVWAYASVKRCIPDELVQFDATHERGELVRCTVVEVNERISILDLLGLEARIHVDSLGEQEAADCASVLHEGQILWAKYLGFLSRGSKGRYLQVSMKDLGGSEKVAREFVEARNSEKAEER
jgi:ribosomal protein S1